MYIAALLVYLVLCICVYRFCSCLSSYKFQPFSGFLFLSRKSGPCIFIFLCLLVFSILSLCSPPSICLAVFIVHSHCVSFHSPGF